MVELIHSKRTLFRSVLPRLLCEPAINGNGEKLGEHGKVNSKISFPKITEEQKKDQQLNFTASSKKFMANRNLLARGS